MPENNKERVEELQKNIENWKKELEEVWAGKDTDAAEVERRNLRNLISNAEREMSELQPNKANNEINNEEIKPEDLLNELQGKNSAKNAEQNRIKLQIERLKEEREDYKDDKALYEEYGKKIEELENEIKDEEKTQEQKDKEIRILTKGRMEAENNAKEIEKQIRQKRREIEDIEYGTKESMEEMKLESGENIKQPKVLRIYKEIEELENKLRQEKDKIEEYQKVIDELKGIDKEKKQETRELNPEEIRYFHGQGDYREQTGENGEDLRKNRLDNDEYFGIGKKPADEKDKKDIKDKDEPIPIPEPEEPRKDLPIRSFWEIYNDTCSEHANNLSIKLHNFAHMKILPRKEEDTVTKVLSGVLIPIKLATKAVAIIPNKIAGTDKKLQEMQDKIDELSPQEFQVLVSSSDKANMMFGDHVKDSFDKDYLEPQFMKNYKVNELYLKAVGGRLTRERVAGIEYYKEQILNCDNRIGELDDISSKRPLNLEEQQEYNSLTNMKQQYIDKGKGLRQEIDNFNDGVKKKSSGFKNISGWFLGKFNPDNRSENEKMAKLSKERREASEIGEGIAVSKLTNEMSNYAMEQTKIKGRKNNTIDIGKYSIENSVEMLDKGPEMRGRLVFTNVALITSAINLAKQIANAKDNEAIINQHNETVAKANAENKNIEVSGDTKVSDVPGAKEAQEGLARQTVEGGFNRSERANLDANDWHLGSAGYKAGDAITHHDASEAMKSVNEAIARGDSEGALNIAMEYFGKNAAEQQKAMRAYMNTHDFDYSAINYDAVQDMKAITDFFGGTIHYNENVAGAMVSTIEGINQGIDPLAAIFAGANAVYQAEKQGVRDGWKESLKSEIDNTDRQEQEIEENSQDIDKGIETEDEIGEI